METTAAAIQNEIPSSPRILDDQLDIAAEEYRLNIVFERCSFSSSPHETQSAAGDLTEARKSYRMTKDERGMTKG